ncbi:TPA: hypothetical protein UYJ73_001678 [Enterococcus faecium]|nr:hypothetical protein [Enterococcus faecium]HEL7535886.1 hypothetical protein [Enterococcus faecium]HEL7537812.1 hypothetical protein [Enterococcus faecium]
MKSLQQLISEKESELQNLEDSLGLGFPIVEQAKMVQISHLQLELEDLRQIEDPYQLDDNQQIVLEWLKSNDYSLKLPMLAINQLDRMTDLKVRKAHWQLGRKQEYEVLAAFAQWGLEQEENHNGIN